MLSRPETHQHYRAVLAQAERDDCVKPALAALGRSDLFFLLVYVLHRKDLDRDWLYARCREVQASPDGHLDLWAREHYKSTIITFGKTIQDILNDPEVTFGLFSHTRPSAKGFLRQIKREFESNALLKDLYPDILWENPQKQAPKWSEDDGLIVRRQTNPKEATLEAWGLVDGQPTGKHFRVRVYDDVVTKESVGSPDMIKKTTEAWELSINLGVDGGASRYIGTRYHLFDTYATMMERQAVRPRLHPATADGSEFGEPVLLSWEALQDKRRDMGPYTFACQMLQNPLADRAMGFRREWVRYWEPSADAWRHMNRVLLVDPAGERKSGSDYTVMWVLGLAEDLNYYLIDGVRDRLNLTQRAEALIRLHRTYRPQWTGYEKYGMQADIEHVRYIQDQRGYRFHIEPLGGQMPKNDRIRRLVPLFERGRFYLPDRLPYVDHEGGGHDLVEEFLREELLAFPVCAHDDMLDCMARVLDEPLGAHFPDAREWTQATGWGKPQFAAGVVDNWGGLLQEGR